MKCNTKEAQLLRRATAAVERSLGSCVETRRQELRFQILEAVASRIGGFDLADYQRRFNVKSEIDADRLSKIARTVVTEIISSGIPAALAVSALAREALDASTKKNSGAYHTDFRLAQHLAANVAEEIKPGAKIIDPACGAGILLTAVALAVCGADRKFTNVWLSRSVFASDLSPNALRGTLISLACLTNSVDALVRMRANWKVQDSLLAGLEGWRSVKGGFDVVVANPPWEKIKISRHEFIQAEGGRRHYGAAYEHFDNKRFEDQKSTADSYGSQLALRYPCLASGEPDLYVAFAELLVNLSKPGGYISLILPAGLIRSQSTELLRQHLIQQSRQLSFQILDNRARFFEIDTRFKFLIVAARKRVGKERLEPIEISHAVGTATGIEATPRVRIGRSALAKLRPDLSIPEVKTEQEWKLFIRMADRGIDWAKQESAWRPDFVREVDMTRDRPNFLSKKGKAGLPIVEGRMVHQHRFGAKSYSRGTGRAAVWELNPPGESKVAPQFWIEARSTTAKVVSRSKHIRAGFCDITGQTNERSCLAAMIPAGVVCGNKVPTVTFPNDPSEERMWLWVSLVNSIAFDWMVRRVITTTINYFHLLSLPLPPLNPDSLPGRKLVDIARRLNVLDTATCSLEIHREMANLRAKADSIILNAYGLGPEDLDLMMADFPLIDRAQPPLNGEAKSTVTRDLIQSFCRDKAVALASQRRVDEAARLGAVAFMPAQMGSLFSNDSQVESENG